LQPGNELTEKYIYNKLKSYNLEVFEQSSGSLLKNIYAIQNGKDNTKTIIISAHFDCCGNYSCDTDSAIVAPGADDNASGVSATLECARIISKYLTNYKIIYAFWDAEEQGLIGSEYYAANINDNIIAVINLDMIGWDSNNDGLIEIHEKDTTASNFINLPNLITEVNSNYNIGLQPILYKPGTWRSDHYSFWQNNYNAILLIEGLYSDDFNKYYHSQNDILENFNMEYYQNSSKLAIASIATIAEIQDYKSNIPSDYSITQNFPNPFNSETNINFSIPTNNYVSIEITDILGQNVETLVADYLNAGNYEIKFKADKLSSGVFIYTISSGKYRMSRKMMYLK
jgi:Zn-dependent M28 family amino/carboxypeptidase